MANLPEDKKSTPKGDYSTLGHVCFIISLHIYIPFLTLPYLTSPVFPCSLHEQPVPHRGDPRRAGAGHRQARGGGEEEGLTEEA